MSPVLLIVGQVMGYPPSILVEPVGSCQVVSSRSIEVMQPLVISPPAGLVSSKMIVIKLIIPIRVG